MQASRTIVLVAAAFVAGAIIAHGGDAPFQGKFSKFGVSLDLPVGVETVETKGPDFFLYYFVENRERQVLFAYLGTAPSFPNSAPRGLETITESIGGFSTKSIRWPDINGGYCRESLVDLGGVGWPRFIHFAYAGLSEEASKKSDAIIATLRYSASATK
jgi:hypothetical protein